MTACPSSSYLIAFEPHFAAGEDLWRGIHRSVMTWSHGGPPRDLAYCALRGWEALRAPELKLLRSGRPGKVHRWESFARRVLFEHKELPCARGELGLQPAVFVHVVGVVGGPPAGLGRRGRERDARMAQRFATADESNAVFGVVEGDGDGDRFVRRDGNLARIEAAPSLAGERDRVGAGLQDRGFDGVHRALGAGGRPGALDAQRRSRDDSGPQMDRGPYTGR